VLRRRERRRFSSASDDEVGGTMRAMREQLLNRGLYGFTPWAWSQGTGLTAL
jgi:hypothetical protein